MVQELTPMKFLITDEKKHVRTHLGLLNISVYKHSILTTDLKPFLGIKLIIDLINYYILLI